MSTTLSPRAAAIVEDFRYILQQQERAAAHRAAYIAGKRDGLTRANHYDSLAEERMQMFAMRLDEALSAVPSPPSDALQDRDLNISVESPASHAVEKGARRADGESLHDTLGDPEE